MFVTRETFETAMRAALETREREKADLLARFDEVMTWNRTLVQTIVDLKRENFAKAPAVATPRQPQPGPLDIEDIARAGAMKEAIERMTADFTRNGADPEDAAREARKLIGEMHAVYDLE